MCFFKMHASIFKNNGLNWSDMYFMEREWWIGTELGVGIAW